MTSTSWQRSIPTAAKQKQKKVLGLFLSTKKIGATFGTEELSSLVYRVTPVPATLRDFVFDYGALPEIQEREYIRQMVHSTLNMYPIPGWIFFLYFNFFF